MRPIWGFAISALGLVILYIVLTGANQRNGAAPMLANSAFGQFNALIAQLQGRRSGVVA